MNKIIEYVESFIEYIRIEKAYSSHTIKAYRNDLEHLTDFLSDNGISEIGDFTGEIIHQYLFHLRRQQYEYSSMERKLSTLKSFFSFLIKTETISKNPAKDVPFPKKRKSLPVFLSQREIMDLLENTDVRSELSYRDLAILELLYASGIRLSEIHKLNMDSVDFAGKQIRVEGKGNKTRIVPVNEICIERLMQYITTMRNRLKNRDDKALFLSRNGKRLCQRHIAKIVKGFTARVLGRTDISPHSIRHSYATHLLENGAEIKIISKLLGHSSINTTQRYTHLNLQKIRETYQKSHPHSRKNTKENNDDDGI